MAWDHLSITKPHLVYIVLGGFTTLFMLCSSVIKERLYIGEATVATICGIIFGPHAADLVNPLSWGNTDLITLEFSRIVLVVQCFAVGVELPRAYMEKHWKSVTLLLIPVMAYGWLITSLFIWWMFRSHLNWLDSLCIAACVTATDPVLASSVVGKGKFARRVPKHLRDLLSAESGCNDGMAFPFIYLAVYLIRYRPLAEKVAFHWFCVSILYECVFGTIYGVIIGYLARRAIRYAHEKDLIDRESFLVFYFVLALFCAGSGSILGLDDLLVGFAAGVGFSNDGWFLEKTEEAHVSNVIDLLINLAFFVYFGSIIPWGLYNSPIIGTSPWRLVVLALLVLFFRRIPIMMVLKPIIPDIKTWREALFAGHFGPIGVGGLFVAILARAELETHSTTPLAELPEEGFEHLNIIELIWPITTFLVITSIIVHGSSIAVFTLGKRINTLTLTLSYTQANEDGPSWMERLPRIQSRSKSSMSLRRPSESSLDEKAENTGSGLLSPISLPAQFLRRQKEEESSSRASSVRPSARRKRWETGVGPGGPISQSAIAPDRRNRDQDAATPNLQDSDTLAAEESPGDSPDQLEAENIYTEGNKVIIEDREGNVLAVRDTRGESSSERQHDIEEEAVHQLHEKHVEHGVAQTEHGGKAEEAPGKAVEAVEKGVERPAGAWRDMRKRMESFSGIAGRRHEGEEPSAPPQAHKPPQRRGPALAYQFGNTIIVEDEDGEVLKKYDIPAPVKGRPAVDRKTSFAAETGGRAMESLKKMGGRVGLHRHESEAGPSKGKAKPLDHDDDDKIRFTVTAGGRRMSKAEFIKQMSSLDPKARAKLVEDSDVPEGVKREVRKDAKEHTARQRAAATAKIPPVLGEEGEAQLQKPAPDELDDSKRGPEGITLVDSNEEEIPFHSVARDLEKYTMDNGQDSETGAQRRRRQADDPQPLSPDQRDFAETPDEEPPTMREARSDGRRRVAAMSSSASGSGASTPDSTARKQAVSSSGLKSRMDEGETVAERKRRLGALGISKEAPDSESEDEEGGDPLETGRGTHSHVSSHPHSGSRPQTAEPERPSIRFAEPRREAVLKEDDEKEAGTGASGSGSGHHGVMSRIGRLKWGGVKREE
jgi:Na(+)/H(+) antiporter